MKRPLTETALRIHFDVAFPTIKKGAKLGIHNLKAIKNGLNGGNVIAIALRQSGDAGPAALRAPKFFVPLG
jgi:hypothetical protein